MVADQCLLVSGGSELEVRKRLVLEDLKMPRKVNSGYPPQVEELGVMKALRRC